MRMHAANRHARCQQTSKSSRPGPEDLRPQRRRRGARFMPCNHRTAFKNQGPVPGRGRRRSRTARRKWSDRCSSREIPCRRRGPRACPQPLRRSPRLGCLGPSSLRPARSPSCSRRGQLGPLLHERREGQRRGRPAGRPAALELHDGGRGDVLHHHRNRPVERVRPACRRQLQLDAGTRRPVYSGATAPATIEQGIAAAASPTCSMVRATPGTVGSPRERGRHRELREASAASAASAASLARTRADGSRSQKESRLGALKPARRHEIRG